MGRPVLVGLSRHLVVVCLLKGQRWCTSKRVIDIVENMTGQREKKQTWSRHRMDQEIYNRCGLNRMDQKKIDVV